MNQAKRFKPKDFHEYTRMGTDALIVILLSSLVKSIKAIWPILLVFFLSLLIKGVNSQSNLPIVIAIIAGLMGLIILASVVRYLTFRFCMRDGEIRIKYGFFSKNARAIPLTRVHALRTKRGIFYRLTDMVGITFDTVASDKEELELILSEQDWAYLLSTIESEDGEEKGEEPTPEAVEEEQKGVEEGQTYHYSLGELIQAAASQNHLRGVSKIFVVIAFFWNQIADQIDYQVLWEKYGSGFYSDFVHQVEVLRWATFPILFLAVYIVSFILWLLYFIYREYDLSITLYPNRLVYDSGLVTKKFSRVRRDKVISMTFKRNFVEEKLGRSSISIGQATFARGEKGKQILVIHGWKEPQKLFNWWLSDLTDEGEAGLKDEGEKLHSRLGVFYYHFFWRLAISIACLVFSFFWLPELLLPIGILILIFGSIGSVLAYKRSAISMKQCYIDIFHGRFSHKRTFIPYEKVESVKLRQSIIQKYSGSTHLVIYTMGNTHVVRSLPYTDAQLIRDYILYKTSVEKV